MSANGRLTDAELQVVEDNDRLNHRTANAFRRARAAWYASGGSGPCIVEPAGAYRSWQVQYDMKHGIPSFAYWNLNPNSKAGLASAGSSTHGLGDRFDATPGFNAFLLRRGREFGFYREFGANDPNHWRHDGVTAAGVSVTAISSPEEDDMPRYIYTDQDGEGFALIDSNYVDGVVIAPRGAVADQMSWVTRGGAPEKMDRKTFNAACASATSLWRSFASVASSPPISDAQLEAFADEMLDRLGETIATDADLAQLKADLIASLPPAVIVEQKKPGN